MVMNTLRNLYTWKVSFCKELVIESNFSVTGDHCEEAINECLSSPCQNTGYCQDLIGHYLCYCPSGYTGVNCEVNIDDCVNNTCEHGNCTDLVDGYECDCELGYGG